MWNNYKNMDLFLVLVGESEVAVLAGELVWDGHVLRQRLLGHLQPT